LGEIQCVLQNLLRERVPIRNLPVILEVLADHGKKIKDPEQLTELVRQRMGRVLCEMHGGKGGEIACIVVDPHLESAIEQELIGQSTGTMTAVTLQKIQESAAACYTDAIQMGKEPIILTRATVRRYIADMLHGMKPRIPVLAFNEITSAKKVEPVGQVSITPTAEPVSLELSA
jgi:flagellar biosynthesis protein FlhA